jgi:uncharacterized protein with HEPN domain
VTLDEIRALGLRLAELCERYGIADLSVFGSVARGDARRDELYVADLVDNTRAIREYLDGISREQWDQDRVRRDAVVYRLLLLGETASALPDILRDRYPDVAWRQIRAFRNLAVHKTTRSGRPGMPVARRQGLR